MLIGAHVSPSGGPAQAVARGVERAARSIQIFNQNPRQWKPREYSEEEISEFHAAIKDSDVDALLIHAVYLLNPASEDPDFREKTLASLISSLRAGAALGAEAVVLHPGSALKTGGEVDAAIDRAGEVIAEALKESEKCPLHLEDTAGAGGTLGRSFEELARLIEVAGGGKRLGVCLDSCHLLASGYDVRSAEALSDVLDEFDRVVGLKRLGSLHVNDSVTPLGSNRDRHANLGDGEIGREGIAAFLSEPRFEGMPCVLEGPGHTGKAVDRQDIEWAMQLREEGLAARGGGGAKRKRGGGKGGSAKQSGVKQGGAKPGSSAKQSAKPGSSAKQSGGKGGSAKQSGAKQGSSAKQRGGKGGRPKQRGKGGDAKQSGAKRARGGGARRR